MIVIYVDSNHESWDQFLNQFAYALRSAIHETTGKTTAELFLGRNPISEVGESVVGSDLVYRNVLQLLEEIKQYTKVQQRKRAKCYSENRNEMKVKVNEEVCCKYVHPMGSANNQIVLSTSIRVM
ncbi:hypothetical protein TNCV_1132131 [Trichonephila clavipes]|nr:hypothetical protein TNCV_1132131 [Trichonephila clavipes]